MLRPINLISVLCTAALLVACGDTLQVKSDADATPFGGACFERECGPDGLGGSCGTCFGGLACVGGKCKDLSLLGQDVTDASNKSLVFTNNRADAHEDAGDVISYIRAGDQATIEVHDQSDGLDYEAHWSITTTEGSLKVPGYNNGEEACWDAQHLNRACE